MTTETVREIVTKNPETVRVFESLGIDYCCGGERPVREACDHAGVAPERLAELLEKAVADANPPEESRRWIEAPLSDLTAHIVREYHGRVRQEGPRLEGLFERVITRHAALHPDLFRPRELFASLVDEMLTHQLKEEQVLFPYIEKMEAAAAAHEPLPAAFFGSVRNPIAHMIADHDDAGSLLKELRAATSDFQVPEDACTTWRGLYKGLEEFERDLHRHLHLENNILFPRALKLETDNAADASR